MSKLPEHIVVETPGILDMDDAMEIAFGVLGLPRLGGASGKGWSRYRLLQECPRKFQLRHIKRVQTERSSKALNIGICFHAFLAIYYLNMKRLIAGEEEYATPRALRDALLDAKANADHIAEGWRIFDAYADRYETVGDYLEPLGIEELAVDPKTGNSCRYDLIARVGDDGPQWGVLPGTYIIEHKCQVASSVLMDYVTGRRWTMGELFAQQHALTVQAVDPDGQLANMPAGIPVPNGVRDVYRVTLSSGRHLETSDNHPFLTARGWIPAAELSDTDWVAVPATTALGNAIGGAFTDDEILFIGHMIGDGGLTAGIKYTKASNVDRARFVDLVERMGYSEGGGTPTSYRIDCGTAQREPTVCLSAAAESHARQLLERVDLYGKHSVEKVLHRSLFELPDRQTAILLGGLWDTDGCVDVFTEVRVDKSPQEKVRIAYVSRSHGLCVGVQTLLLRLGLQSTVTESSVEYKNERRPYWTTKVITRESKRLFLALIREATLPIYKYTAEHLATAAFAIKRGDDRPIPTDLIRDLPMTGVQRNKLLGRRRSVFASTVSRVLGDVASPILNQEVRWDRVKSIIVSGREMMYDITVPAVHNFVANDIITHNSAGKMDKATTEGWHLDGEVIGQLMLWKKAKLSRKYGKLRGVIVNIVTKSKVPKFHREIVAPPNNQLRAQENDLFVWDSLQQLFKSMRCWPRSLQACYGRYGPCEYVEHCREHPR